MTLLPSLFMTVLDYFINSFLGVVFFRNHTNFIKVGYDQAVIFLETLVYLNLYDLQMFRVTVLILFMVSFTNKLT